MASVIFGIQSSDVFASTAYYLSKAGWRDDITWGRAVRIPAGFSLDGKNATELADKNKNEAE